MTDTCCYNIVVVTTSFTGLLALSKDDVDASEVSEATSPNQDKSSELSKVIRYQEEETDLHDRLAIEEENRKIEEEKRKPAKDALKDRIKFYAERELEIHGILKRYLKMDLLVPLDFNEATYDDLKARELEHVIRQQEYTTLPLPTNIFISSIARRELVYRGGGLTLPQSKADREYLRTCHIPPKTPVVTTSANTSRKRKRGT